MQENDLSLLGGLTAALEYLELSGHVCMFVHYEGCGKKQQMYKGDCLIGIVAMIKIYC